MHFSHDEVKENFEYVSSERGVDAYRDKRTGKMFYTPSPPKVDPETVRKIEALYRKAADLAPADLILSEAKLGLFESRKLNKAIRQLQEVVEIAPRHVSALFLLGMCLRRAGKEDEALPCFRQSYALDPSPTRTGGDSGVGREYAHQCLRLGLGEEGVRVARELHARFPEDPVLHSNLALALLIGGDLEEARTVALAAQAQDPKDAVTRKIVDYIERVRSGAAPRPRRLSGMR